MADQVSNVLRELPNRCDKQVRKCFSPWLPEYKALVRTLETHAIRPWYYAA